MSVGQPRRTGHHQSAIEGNVKRDAASGSTGNRLRRASGLGPARPRSTGGARAIATPGEATHPDEDGRTVNFDWPFARIDYILVREARVVSCERWLDSPVQEVGERPL